MSELLARLRKISSRDNALVKELRRAFSHGEPTPAGDCAIESIRIVEEAIRSGLKFRAVFFSSNALQVAERLLPQVGAHVDTVELPDDIFRSAVATEAPQGVAALVRLRTHDLEALLRTGTAAPLVMCVAGLQDPGNLGTVIRSAEAFGATGVLLGEKTVSRYNAKVVRAAAGSLFRLPVVETQLVPALETFRARGLRVVATSSHNATPLTQASLTGPLAVVIGSEGGGVPREVLRMADETIAIPHSAQVESLNAGVAASIILYELSRQRSE